LIWSLGSKGDPVQTRWRGLFAFDVGHNHGQHSVCERQFRLCCKPYASSWAGAGSVLQLTPTRVAGDRRSPKGRNDAQLFAQSRTLRIRQTVGLDLSIARSNSPLQPVEYYLCVIFIRFRGPQAQT
jgi:hypothetical protein